MTKLRDFFPKSRPRADGGIDVDARRPMRHVLWVMLIALGGFFLWAAFAPLDAGVVSNATVKVVNDRKKIQHERGGIVEAIWVREGQAVQKGQVLIRLNATRAIAEQGALSTEYIVASTVEDRLEAERDRREEIRFSPALLDRFGNDAHLKDAMELQRRLFATRRIALSGEINILKESLRAAQEQLGGFERVKATREAQLRFIGEELVGVRSLADEGYVPRNRLLELERNAAQLNGALAEDIGNTGKVRNQISEIKLRILQREQDHQKELQLQLTDAQRDAAMLMDRLRAIDYEVANAQVYSPINGIVLGLNVSTLGGVIQPGAHLMDIVPEHEPLQVDAMIPVHAIDKMKAGLAVDISFPAFNHSSTPSIPGKVLTVSADSLIDESSKLPYYLAQIVVTAEGMKMLGVNQIRAGMPATVTIKTGERSLLSYLLKPLLERLDGAFKEQ
ncbi:metalloprotease secretion protein [Jeongeupia sp. HS-3]|uniref:HlyD family type I secretion periplasmic adaptor subunit n=1 Tax=Jeongeupia sp. HS-3 TaxID=1009682 RepID=UPI0018A5AB98|nr:HlyD family type I secretion periplasmic adaptor subunit [Jeongeupia sp. HS-3]BCL74568.1 metalloprotease secretion protein [Jeongeupia sp. HS-3]